MKGVLLSELMQKQLNGIGHLIVTVTIYLSLTFLLFFGKIPLDAFYIVSGPIILFWFSTGLATQLNSPKKDGT